MQIGILGPLEVRTDEGDLVEVTGARLRALLVVLALEAGRVVAQPVLVDRIWGENPPAGATNALQGLVSRLRKVLPVEGHANGYRLSVTPEAVDAVRFERLVERARGVQGSQRVRLLGEALALWRGPVMEGTAATRLEALRLTALEDRFEAEISADDVAELTDLVTTHPLRERLVASLMRALATAGRDTEALLVYQRTREALVEALGVDPSPQLSELHTTLLQSNLGQPEQPRKTNLQAELTSYVGKDRDVAAVRRLLGEHRLITLIGPGGSGKTRLATETARTLLGELPDGAWLVELATIGSGGEVPQAALAGLGLRDDLLGESSNVALTDRLISAIRDRETLLVLDNCEHVIEAAAKFADRVLGECPRLRILATSREPLGITGEALWPVEPLAPPAEDADLEGVETSPAVQLLRNRAGAVRGDLVFDARTLELMARVCRALDGMPLAIELAAARLRTMSVEQLANRLDDRFWLLTNGSRTALPRHKTLRAVVDWSWELLTGAERSVLRRLAVFAGGASLEAAERVCAPDGGGEHVLELLTSLAEKSLLIPDDSATPRYRMTGTIREYAAHRLAEAGETDLARRAHLAYFVELTETAEPYLRRAEQMEWLAVLDAEHDNIGAAMRGALAADESEEAMRLAAGTGWYWWLSGHKTEGLELMVAATGIPDEVSDETRAMVYGLVVQFLSSGRGGRTRGRGVDPPGAPCRSGDFAGAPAPLSAAGARGSDGAHAARTGRDPVGVRVPAGRRGPLGARPGPSAARQGADPARAGRSRGELLSGRSAGGVPCAR